MYQVATNYKHVQDVPQATWSIKHNLRTYPIIDVYVLSEGELQKILPEAVIYIDQNTCSVEFRAPISGFAVIV